MTRHAAAEPAPVKGLSDLQAFVLAALVAASAGFAAGLFTEVSRGEAERSALEGRVADLEYENAQLRRGRR